MCAAGGEEDCYKEEERSLEENVLRSLKLSMVNYEVRSSCPKKRKDSDEKNNSDTEVLKRSGVVVTLKQRAVNKGGKCTMGMK